MAAAVFFLLFELRSHSCCCLAYALGCLGYSGRMRRAFGSRLASPSLRVSRKICGFTFKIDFIFTNFSASRNTTSVSADLASSVLLRWLHSVSFLAIRLPLQSIFLTAVTTAMTLPALKWSIPSVFKISLNLIDVYPM